MHRIPVWKFLLITVVVAGLGVAMSLNAAREEARRAEFILAAGMAWVVLAYVVHNQFWGHKQSPPKKLVIWAAMIAVIGMTGSVYGLTKKGLWVIPIALSILGTCGIVVGISWLRGRRQDKPSDRQQ